MLKTAVKSGDGRRCSGIRCSFCSARLPQAEVLADIELQGALTWRAGVATRLMRLDVQAEQGQGLIE